MSILIKCKQTGVEIFKNSYLQWVLLKFYNDFLHYYVSTKIFQKQQFADVLRNRCSYKFRKIHKKKTRAVSCTVFLWIFYVFSFPTEHIRMTASETYTIFFLRTFSSVCNFETVKLLFRRSNKIWGKGLICKSPSVTFN